jgi:hypothetical protein
MVATVGVSTPDLGANQEGEGQEPAQQSLAEYAAQVASKAPPLAPDVRDKLALLLQADDAA